jgi:hypothetical protein
MSIKEKKIDGLETHSPESSESLSAFTRADIQTVLDNNPLLCDSGFTSHRERGRSAEESKRMFDQRRNELLNSVDECNRCCEWITANLQPVKTPTTESYHLKHVAEKDIGYITNGLFIVAALLCGLTVKRYSINAGVGVSKRSVTDVCKRQNAAGKANWCV